MATSIRHLEIRMRVQDILWLKKQKDEIDFAPTYQRKSRIWSVANKQYLIDSILNGFDVPKIYLADFTFGRHDLNRTGQRYAVIDGKQRLEAVYGFIDGDYVLSPSFVYMDDPEVEAASLGYRELGLRYPELRQRFDRFSLAIMSVATNDQANISQLFVRLNTSKPLTGAELRNAMPGRVPSIIRQLVEHEFFSDYLPFSTLRSEDKNLAAKLLLLEHRGAPVDTKKRQLDALVRAVGQDEEVEELRVEALDLLASTDSADFKSSASRVRALLDRMCDVFGEKDPLLRQPGQIPVYYWFIRDMKSVSPDRLRQFLEWFQSERENNKRRAKEGQLTSQDLDRYELLLRSSNDAGSIKQRHMLVTKWWLSWND